MKMIWAEIRPESAQTVIEALDRAGIDGITRLQGTGRDGDTGITTGPLQYPESHKEILMIVVPDDEVAKTVRIIRAEAKTGLKNFSEEGMIDGGKIFVTYVEDTFAIRSASKTGGMPKE